MFICVQRAMKCFLIHSLLTLFIFIGFNYNTKQQKQMNNNTVLKD